MFNGPRDKMHVLLRSWRGQATLEEKNSPPVVAGTQAPDLAKSDKANLEAIRSSVAAAPAGTVAPAETPVVQKGDRQGATVQEFFNFQPLLPGTPGPFQNKSSGGVQVLPSKDGCSAEPQRGRGFMWPLTSPGINYRRCPDGSGIVDAGFVFARTRVCSCMIPHRDLPRRIPHRMSRIPHRDLPCPIAPRRSPHRLPRRTIPRRRPRRIPHASPRRNSPPGGELRCGMPHRMIPRRTMQHRIPIRIPRRIPAPGHRLPHSRMIRLLPNRLPRMTPRRLAAAPKPSVTQQNDPAPAVQEQEDDFIASTALLWM